MPATAPSVIENTIPVLSVADVQASIRFYCDLLGFKRDWGGEGDTSHIASVSRDGQAIMLEHGDPVTPGCVWIGGSAFTALWQKIRAAANVKILQRPTNQYYALEMRIADPDGNVLWFGTETMEGIPFGQHPPDSEL